MAAASKAGKRPKTSHPTGSTPKPARLSLEKYAMKRAEAEAIADEEVRHSPTRLGERILWARAILSAAQQGAADLLRVPMDPDPDLTEQELSELSDSIHFLEQMDDELHDKRVHPHTPELVALIAEARTLETAVIVGMSHLFRKEPKVLRQLRTIKQGDGLSDLMQDASNLWALWQQHKAVCKKLCKGEAQKLALLVEASNQLSQLQASMPQARDLRQLRDRAYSLVMRGIERIREAAAYFYSDQPERLAAFAAFAAEGKRSRSHKSKAAS